MASIAKRKLAGNLTVYRARVRRKGHPDLSKTFLRHADAVAWAATTEGEVARGVYIDRTEAERMTIADGLEKYLNEVTEKKRGVGAETYLVKSLLKTRLAKFTFASLRSKDVKAWCKERQDPRRPDSVSGETVLRALAVLSHLYTTARRSWGMEGLPNPIDSVEKPKHSRGRTRRLQPGEEEELLMRARSYGEPLPSIIVLALETAMRRGELAGLRWEDIDVRRRIAHLAITKNGESRDVPLSTRAMEVLQRLPRRLDGRVFGMRPDAITKAFERAIGSVGHKPRVHPGRKPKKSTATVPLQNLRFHDLRHEAVSRLFEKGLNPMQVAAIDGHKTLAMLKRYTHPRAEDLVALLG